MKPTPPITPASPASEMRDSERANGLTATAGAVQVDSVTLLMMLREGWRMRPVRWTDATIFRDGHCYVRDRHTFVQHTPYTVGVETSPAIVGAEEAIRQFGDEWVLI